MNLFRRIIYTRIEMSDEPPRLAKFMMERKLVGGEWQAMAVIFLIIIISASLSIVFFSNT